MELFLRMGTPSDSITGSSSYPNHEGWIPLKTMQFESGRVIEMRHGSTRAQITGSAYLKELVLTKATERSSVLLFQASVIGERTSATIHVMADSTHAVPSSSADPLLSFEFSEVLVSAFEYAIVGGSAVERVRFVYEKITLEYRGYNDRDQDLAVITAQHELRAGA